MNIIRHARVNLRLTKTTKVTSYYLLSCLTLANGIPKALIDQVRPSYSMKCSFLSFLPDKQKQNNKERRYIKELWSDGSHAVHWVSGPSGPFSRLYKTGRLLKYLTVKKSNKNKEKGGGTTDKINKTGPVTDVYRWCRRVKKCGCATKGGWKILKELAGHIF